MNENLRGELTALANKARGAASFLAAINTDRKNEALRAVAARLVSETDYILKANSLDLASAGMAENGCMRVGQTSSVYTLPDYIRGERSEHLKICGTRPMNIPNAKTQR